MKTGEGLVCNFYYITSDWARKSQTILKVRILQHMMTYESSIDGISRSGGRGGVHVIVAMCDAGV